MAYKIYFECCNLTISLPIPLGMRFMLHEVAYEFVVSLMEILATKEIRMYE